MEATVCQEEIDRRIEEVIARYKGVPSGLIQVLHQVQIAYGYLPKEVLLKVSEGLGVPLNEVYGVATFYAFFSLKPKGKYNVQVCKGTACYVRGAQRVIERLEKELGIPAGDTTDDHKFSIEIVRCLGACGLGPVFMIGEDVHARLKPDMVPGILGAYK
ncbi:MAG: NADH-quinone oxidoreductase subunit NuoE [Firmicutes bacterium]|nr:NADH-quinone oxidoreductase subunit NuoE [Bacillota bacterium]